MRPTKVKPAPVSTNPPKQNSSSSQGSGVWDSSSAKGFPVPEPSSRSSLVLDPSSPKGPPLLHPSSSRGTLLPDLSSPKGPPALNSPSFRKSLLPDPSCPRGAPVPDPSSPRGLMASCSSTFGSFLVPDPFPPQPPMSQNVQLSSDSLGQGSSTLSGSLHQISSNENDPVLEIHVPVTKAKEFRSDDATLNWRLAAVALLFVCILLLTMVSLMSVKVSELEWRSKEEMDIMELQILVLSETLQELQIGKVWTCTVCKVRWVQRADLCFLFSDLKASWQTSQSICLEESSALAVMETKEEMDFLRDESSKYFDIVYQKYQYHQFWIGLEYHNSSSLVLRDGTLLPLQLSAEVEPHPCIYLQNGSFFTEPCQMTCYFICEAKVQFG